MQFYTVHEPPEPPIDPIDRAGSLVFIGDRFTPLALAFGAFWLLAYRLWHAFAAYVLALAAVVLIVLVSDLNWRWITWMMGAFNLFLAFEAPSLRRWALERRGWRTLGSVSGNSLDECERRFLEGYLLDQRLAAENGTMSATAASAASERFLASSISDAGGRLAPIRRSWLWWRTGTSST